MSHSSSAPCLVACPDVAAYERVAETVRGVPASARTVPVLSRGDVSLKGFPTGTTVVPFPSWRPAANQRGQTTAARPTGRLCISVDDPACNAVARLLAALQGKRSSVCLADTAF